MGKKKFFLLAFLAVLIASIPFTISILKTPQDPRSRAQYAGSAKLSFEPESSTTSPIQKSIGETVAIDMILDPGTELVSFVKFQIAFDPTKLTLDTDNPFTINNDAFPVKVEGPIVTNNSLGQSLSVGADGTKVIQNKTKIGTVNFRAIGGTGSAVTTVSFNNITQVLSGGSDDGYKTNVLATTTPSYIAIGGTDNLSPTISINPCLQSCPSITPGSSITPDPNQTTISFDLLLHGVGAAGDNPNPTGNSLSNKTPLHPQRQLTVEILNSANQPVATSAGAINYDVQAGSFKGSIAFNQAVDGQYTIKVKTPRYLRKRIAGVQTIKPRQDNRITRTDLIAGDTNGDNFLDVRDYNSFLDCGYGALDPLPIADNNSLFNKAACQNHKPPENIDINDDGIVDSTDYNLFLRELSVQNGD
jgi:hypothetical protein